MSPMSQTELLCLFKKAFGTSPLSTRECCKALNILNMTKVTDALMLQIYYQLMRGFNSKDMYLKLLLISTLNINKISQSFLVVSCLQKELSENPDNLLKNRAFLCLYQLVPNNFLNEFSNMLETCLKVNERKSAAVIVCYCILNNQKDKVIDANQMLKSGISASLEENTALNKQIIRKTFQRADLICRNIINDYHALSLLYQTKDSGYFDSLNVKNFSDLSLLNLLSILDATDSEKLNLVLKTVIPQENDMCAVEGIKIVVKRELTFLYDICVKRLRTLLQSSKRVVVFAALRICQEITKSQHKNELSNIVKNLKKSQTNDVYHSLKPKSTFIDALNPVFENLFNNSNKQTKLLLISILLKTGNEKTIDSLIKNIPDIITDLSDEYKILIIDVLTNLCLKFENKENMFLDFVKKCLNEKNNIKYKRYVIFTLKNIVLYKKYTINSKILNSGDTQKKIEQTNKFFDSTLQMLAEYIEDCSNTTLNMDILNLMQILLKSQQNPVKYFVTFVNRTIVEQNMGICGSLFNLFLLTKSDNKKLNQFESYIRNLLNKHATNDDPLISHTSQFLLRQKNVAENIDLDFGDLKELIDQNLGVSESQQKSESKPLVVKSLLKKSAEIAILTNNDFDITAQKIIHINYVDIVFCVKNKMEKCGIKNRKLNFLIKTHTKEKGSFEIDASSTTKRILLKESTDACDFLLTNTIFDLKQIDQITIYGKVSYDIYTLEDESECEREVCEIVPIQINFIDLSTNIYKKADLIYKKNVQFAISDENKVKQKFKEMLNIKVTYINEETILYSGMYNDVYYEIEIKIENSNCCVEIRSENEDMLRKIHDTIM